MSIYQYSATLMNGKEKSLATYKGRVILIVNTATLCGFARQFKELEEIYQKYKNDGFVVLGFPSNQFMKQEPGSNEKVAERCQINFSISFPLFKKIDVKGSNAHPLYKHLTKAQKGLFTAGIKWNFTKFLINSNGEVMNRYAPMTPPLNIEEDIRSLLDSVPPNE